MDILKSIKMECLKQNITLQELLNRYNEKYETNIIYASFHRTLTNGTIKYLDYVKFMDILGYDIVARKRAE